MVKQANRVKRIMICPDAEGAPEIGANLVFGQCCRILFQLPPALTGGGLDLAQMRDKSSGAFDGSEHTPDNSAK